MTKAAGADPGFFVGGGRTQKMGALWPLGPQAAPKYVLQLGTVVIWAPFLSIWPLILGQKLALYPHFHHQEENFPIKSQYFDPKSGAFSYRGGGQGPLAPAPGSAPETILPPHFLGHISGSYIGYIFRLG